MKNLVITSLSVLALALTFTGCGGDSGSVASSDALSTVAVNSETTVNSDSTSVVNDGTTTNTTITNEYGLNSELGTPTPLPSN